jgi:hypothetical protein
MTLPNSTESAKKLDSVSNEAQDEQTGALYDFLYRDTNRLASYYAQIFSGRLSQLEETDSDKDVKGHGAKLSAYIAQGDVTTSSEVQTSTKRTIDPHDLITTDVLFSLISDGKINNDIKSASHGSLVMSQGTLVFVDGYMLELAVSAFETISKSNKHKYKKTPEEELGAKGMALLKSVFSKVDIPSAFLLQTSKGIQVAGTIKEQGMEEPISSYYFKHGDAGLSSVYLVGIKEVSSISFTLPDGQLLGAGQAAAQALKNLLFPPDAIMVTPIALFRKL